MKHLIPIALTMAAIALIHKPDVANSQGPESESCISAERCLARIDVRPGLRLPVYTTHPFGRADPRIRRTVIVVHGQNRNADHYFERMVRAARRDKVLGKTLIVAPLFSIASDTVPRKSGDLYWRRSTHWKKGHGSVRIFGRRISSFEVIDRIRARLATEGGFPNLTKLTIIGFSAGGQFVQRYAVGFTGAQGLRTRFVVGSPSSYMYFDRQRPAPQGTGFKKRADTSDCPVNRYKYGPEQRNGYMRHRPLAAMVKSYRIRDVVYLVGADDDDPRSKSLDMRCPARAQGSNRVERAQNFKAYMDRFHAPHNHRLVMVPGIGHASARMFLSRLGREAVFGW
jgi:hypothetical protein